MEIEGIFQVSNPANWVEDGIILWFWKLRRIMRFHPVFDIFFPSILRTSRWGGLSTISIFMSHLITSIIVYKGCLISSASRFSFIGTLAPWIICTSFLILYFLCILILSYKGTVFTACCDGRVESSTQMRQSGSDRWLKWGRGNGHNCPTTQMGFHTSRD